MAVKKDVAKNKKEPVGIEALAFAKALQKIYLGGAVPEVVIDFSQGLADAVDVTNSLFLHVQSGALCLKEMGEVGLGDLALLCKYLESFQGQLTVNKKGNRLLFKSDGNGQFQYLCQEVEFIYTGVKGMDLSKLFDPCILKLNITPEFCKQYAIYFNLIKTKAVELIVDSDNGKLKMVGGLSSEHKFTLDLGKYTMISNSKKNNQDFSIKVYAHHLAAILGVLVWEEDELPELMLAPKHPLLLKQSDDAFWALLPLSENQSDLGEE
jgi:hypothetical protein